MYFHVVTSVYSDIYFASSPYHPLPQTLLSVSAVCVYKFLVACVCCVLAGNVERWSAIRRTVDTEVDRRSSTHSSPRTSPLLARYTRRPAVNLYILQPAIDLAGRLLTLGPTQLSLRHGDSLGPHHHILSLAQPLRCGCRFVWPT